jgi:hypothetical protein
MDASFPIYHPDFPGVSASHTSGRTSEMVQITRLPSGVTDGRLHCGGRLWMR